VDIRWAERNKYSLKVGEPLVNNEYEYIEWDYDSEPVDRVDTAGLSGAVSRPLVGRAAVLLCALRRVESSLDFVTSRRHALGVHRSVRRPSC
jgi:hypothetical protein